MVGSILSVELTSVEPSLNRTKLEDAVSLPVRRLETRVGSTFPSEFKRTTPKCAKLGLAGGSTSVKMPPTRTRPFESRFTVTGVPGEVGGVNRAFAITG